ncbi:hypothetical protein [Marivita sp. S0852]|uniref:hypothetical protein n=1 Tax=Marivita sp. S0852 TaxID=3373893 RepID=UPI003981B1F1
MLTYVCASIAAPDAVIAQDNLTASFGDWRTFCDKGRVCDAYTYSGWEYAQNPNSGHVFSLRRRPTGEGWSMSITFDRVEPKLALGLEASVIRYGHDQPPIPGFQADMLALQGGRVGNGLTGIHELYLMGPSAETVMERLRLGDILDFEFGGCQDEFFSAGFSLSGITAALAWIDKVQGLPPGSVDIVHSAPGTEEGPFPNCGE